MQWLRTGQGERKAQDVYPVSEEEKEILESLRKDKELKKMVRLFIKKATAQKDAIRKIAELLKII